MLDRASLTQFLGQIVTEAEHYRCDAFILMERICKELIDREYHRDDEIDCIIASRKNGFEWIFAYDCDGKSYNWHSILYHEKYNHIYKCKIYWEHSYFGLERQIKFNEISRNEMVECINNWKSTNETLKVVKETIGV